MASLVAMQGGPRVDTELLRNAIRLVHSLQKERGSSCSFYSDNGAFESAMLDARSASDISAALVQQQDLPVISSLAKIRKLIATQRSPERSDDPLALHRIFVCFNTLISYVVHECILKQIIASTDRQSYQSTIKNRHRRGLSSDINEKLLSPSPLTPENEVHKTFPMPCDGANGGYLQNLPNNNYAGNDSSCPPPPPPIPKSDSSSPSRMNSSSPSRRISSFAPQNPRVQQILDLLHLFVQLKESAGVERASLSSILALRGSDNPSVSLLMNDLILEVENQRFLVDKLEQLPEDNHRNLVLELATLSPLLQELQSIILTDFSSLEYAEYDSETIWSIITLYIDKLHSVELLLIEELECCLPVTMKKVISSGALSTLVAPPTKPKAMVLPSPTKIPAPPTDPTEEKLLMGQVLQDLFSVSQAENLASQLDAIPADEIKRRILEVLRGDEKDNAASSPSIHAKEKSMTNGGGGGHQYAGVPSLKDEMNRVLNDPPNRATSKEWEISIYELKFAKRIGVGAAATTYMADWSGQQVAVKVASASRFGLEGWRTEVDALQRLHHPNIIRLLGSVYHENPLTYCLVLEYCNAGDLSTVLKYPTPKNFFFTAALGIANAMTYLHSRRVVHRDLKPANVLCDGNISSGKFTVKVTDFGVAANIKDRGSNESDGNGLNLADNERNLTGETGTYRWMAPEVIRHEAYSTMADVYSFATMLWQFVTREDPFLDVSAVDAARLVALEKHRPPLPQSTPQALSEIIQVNWSDNPNDRWPLETVTEKLRQLQSTSTTDEMAFLESSTGHPVYDCDDHNDDEPSTGEEPKDPPPPVKVRGSLLSQFFGNKKVERKKKGLPTLKLPHDAR